MTGGSRLYTYRLRSTEANEAAEQFLPPTMDDRRHQALTLCPSKYISPWPENWRYASFQAPRRSAITTPEFTVSHARDAVFTRGLRSFFEYRDLGIKRVTVGQVDAHVIRAAAGTEFSGQAHLHTAMFQMVYVLKGWIEFEYEGQGTVRLDAGSCVYQPPEIRHREIGHSSDVEILEIVMPADFMTVEVSAAET